MYLSTLQISEGTIIFEIEDAVWSSALSQVSIQSLHDPSTSLTTHWSQLPADPTIHEFQESNPFHSID